MPPRPPKKPAHEAKFFQPSSFASRKLEAEANIAKRAERRLASMGPTTFTQRNLKTGLDESFEVELYVDIDHPIERFVEFPWQPGHYMPLQDNSTITEQVTNYKLDRPLGPAGERAQRDATRRRPAPVGLITPMVTATRLASPT